MNKVCLFGASVCARVLELCDISMVNQTPVYHEVHVKIHIFEMKCKTLKTFDTSGHFGLLLHSLPLFYG